MDITFRLGTEADIDSLAQLYDELNDHLAETVNYPGWRKGVYPIREDAADGVNERSLFVAEVNGEIAGSVILRHKPEEAYSSVKWQKTLDYDEVFVIYTFVVAPKYLRQGVGKNILEFAEQYAASNNAKALRLDVYEKNLPAIRLYESCGYEYIATVSLGLEEYGLDRFRLYEKLI